LENTSRFQHARRGCRPACRPPAASSFRLRRPASKQSPRACQPPTKTTATGEETNFKFQKAGRGAAAAAACPLPQHMSEAGVREDLRRWRLPGCPTTMVQALLHKSAKQTVPTARNATH